MVKKVEILLKVEDSHAWLSTCITTSESLEKPKIHSVLNYFFNFDTAYIFPSGIPYFQKFYNLGTMYEEMRQVTYSTGISVFYFYIT